MGRSISRRRRPSVCNVGRGDIAKLNSDRQREGAELAVFLTLKPPTRDMTEEAKAVDVYDHALMRRAYPRIQIVTIAEMLEQNKRLDIPLGVEVLKTAQTVTKDLPTPGLFDDAQGE